MPEILDSPPPARRKIPIFGRQVHMPESRGLRIAIGVILIFFGCLGFLPVLGFWMIPLGLLVLSIDIPIVRRWRRQLAVWWHRDRKDDKAEARTPTPARKSKVG